MIAHTQNFLALTEANPIQRILKLKDMAQTSGGDLVMKQMQKIAQNIGVTLDDILKGKVTPETWAHARAKK